MLGERAAVLTDDGELVRTGDEVTGLLAASGPTPVGYLNDPGRSAATFRTLDDKRWSVPGDRAVLHADGSITLLGRGSLVINTGGEKVYPEEVERALLDDENIRDAAVVGIPDGSWGEVVVGAIVLRRSVDLDGLRGKLAKTLAGYKIPRKFVAVDEIPRSPVGKVNYPLVTAMIQPANPGRGDNASHRY